MTTNTKTSYTYAYDGSGVALRFVCEVLETSAERSSIRLTNPSDEVLSTIKYAPLHDSQFTAEQTGTEWVLSVPTAHISTTTYAPLASFNWLD